MTNEEISPADVERLRRGDVGALEAAYRAFGPRVHRTCLGLLGDRAEAEDAVQEVFLKAFERARQFAGESRFSTWLYRIAVNHCSHRRESLRVRRAEELPADERQALAHQGQSPLDEAEAREAREVVLVRLGQLSEAHRAVLVLREIDGLGYGEIAEVLVIPVGTVMSRLARARERWVELDVARKNGRFARGAEA